MSKARFTCLVLSICLAAFAMPSAVVALPDTCLDFRPLGPNDIERQSGGFAGETHCYRLDLPTDGIWHLSVDNSSAGGSTARFEILHAKDQTESLARVARSAQEQVSFAKRGVWMIHILSTDPRQPLPAYRLASRFVSTMGQKSEEDGELEIEDDGFADTCQTSFFKSEEDGELEIEDDGFADTCQTTFSRSEEDGELEIEDDGFAAFFKSEEDGELEIEDDGFADTCQTTFSRSEEDGELEIEDDGFTAFFKSEEDGELEIEDDGFADGGYRLAVRIRQALCETSGDDHGDALICSSPVRSLARAELANGWNDDTDVFRFHVARWQTVEVATRGDMELRGELFDGRGQRLEAIAGFGGFSLVRTLRPGTYFVKISGDSEGTFELGIRALSH